MQHNLGYETNESEAHDYQLALTGDIFRWMLEFAPLETMQRVSVWDDMQTGLLKHLERRCLSKE